MSAVNPSERLIRRRVATLARALPLAHSGDANGVHQARVATRRLREAVPVVAHGASGRRLGRLVRGLTRVLGSVRELDVVLLTLDELAHSADVPERALVCLRQVIDEERARVCTELFRHIDRCNIEKLEKMAIAAARRRQVDGATRLARGGDPRQIAVGRARAARRGVALRQAIEEAGGMYLPDRLHRVRIAVKKLRYAMEIVRELTGSRATARIRTLREAQDVLGRMHDLDVLVMRVRALQGSDSAPSLKLSAELDQLVRHLETDCRQLHVQYLGMKKKVLAVCDHVVADAGEHETAPGRGQ